MMRRGPLADNPVESLLAEAAGERANGILVVRANVDGKVYLVDGEIYMAEIDGQPPLDERLVSAGLLSSSQVDEHGVPGDFGVYLTRALDTDATIDEDAINAYLLDVSAATIARFLGPQEGEFELDPYGAHPAGVLASWSHEVVVEHASELRAEAEKREADRLESERLAVERVEAERIVAARIAAEEEAARLEAERVEAERAEVERAEAEQREIAQLEAARAEAERAMREESGESQSGDDDAEEQLPPGDAAPDVTAAGADDEVHMPHLPPPPLDSPAHDGERGEVDDSDNGIKPSSVRLSPLFDALAANSVPLGERSEGGLGYLESSVLIVVPEEPPNGIDSILLLGVEWRVVVRAAQGDSLGSIADRLGLSLDETRAVVEGLWCRGLVATINASSSSTH